MVVGFVGGEVVKRFKQAPFMAFTEAGVGKASELQDKELREEVEQEVVNDKLSLWPLAKEGGVAKALAIRGLLSSGEGERGGEGNCKSMP